MMNILIILSTNLRKVRNIKHLRIFYSSFDICSARVCFKLMIFKTATFEVIVRILRVTFQGYSSLQTFQKD